MTTERENGYYWVRFSLSKKLEGGETRDIVIGRWHECLWTLAGYWTSYGPEEVEVMSACLIPPRAPGLNTCGVPDAALTEALRSFGPGLADAVAPGEGPHEGVTTDQDPRHQGEDS